MDSLSTLLGESSQIGDWFTTDRLIVAIGGILGPAMLWLIKIGITRLVSTVQSHFTRIDNVLEGIHKSLVELTTMVKIHEEKHERHDEDISRLKDHVYPVKYKK